LKDLIESRAVTTEQIYIKTIAEKFRYEKQLIVKELQKHGIIAVLSTPQKLSINALNKYLELKNKQSI
jgi:prolyl-tRNA editing enzyme YbaK/EbsC (Cys-tRNA(Pro) deacylase)